MKIKEFITVKEDQMFFDLSANLRRSPENDKLSQFTNDSEKRKPVLTLRHINKLKKMKTAQREERAKRQKLISLMYGISTNSEE